MEREILAEGRFARFVRRDGWEFVERTHTSGIVIIVALTTHDALILVEQHRPPVGCRVVELPAGLAGDLAGHEDEPLVAAARRELLEETGFDAPRFEPLAVGPLSAGLTTEIVTVFGARDAVRVAPGGGDDSEDIAVFTVPLADVPRWLADRERAGSLVDPKVYAALWFAARLGEGGAP